MKHLGNRHAHLVCSLVPQLLSSHPYFLTKEPDINDAACILCQLWGTCTIQNEVCSFVVLWINHNKYFTSLDKVLFRRNLKCRHLIKIDPLN